MWCLCLNKPARIIRRIIQLAKEIKIVGSELETVGILLKEDELPIGLKQKKNPFQAHAEEWSLG